MDLNIVSIRLDVGDSYLLCLSRWGLTLQASACTAFPLCFAFVPARTVFCCGDLLAATADLVVGEVVIVCTQSTTVKKKR